MKYNNKILATKLSQKRNATPMLLQNVPPRPTLINTGLFLQWENIFLLDDNMYRVSEVLGSVLIIYIPSQKIPKNLQPHPHGAPCALNGNVP